MATLLHPPCSEPSSPSSIPRIALSLPHPPGTPRSGLEPRLRPLLAWLRPSRLISQWIPARSCCRALGWVRSAAAGPGLCWDGAGQQSRSRAGGGDEAPKSSPNGGAAPGERPGRAGERGTPLRLSGNPGFSCNSHLGMLHGSGVQPPRGAATPGRGPSPKSHQVPAEAAQDLHCHLLSPKPTPRGTPRRWGMVLGRGQWLSP